MELVMDQELKSDPRFQILLAKVETYLQQHQAAKYKELMDRNQLAVYLENQTELAWERIREALDAGYRLNQAEEMAAPLLYQESDESPRREEPNPEEIWLNDRLEKRVLDSAGQAVPFEKS
jgi:hypothetical protein